MIWVGSFAFFGKVTIGLVMKFSGIASGKGNHILGYHALSSTADEVSQHWELRQCGRRVDIPPSMSWQFDSQPGRLSTKLAHCHVLIAG